MSKITFTPINHPYMYGVEATAGDRKAEVVQVDSYGSWHAFLFVGGKIVPGRRPDTDRAGALREAKEFLRGKD